MNISVITHSQLSPLPNHISGIANGIKPLFMVNLFIKINIISIILSNFHKLQTHLT